MNAANPTYSTDDLPQRLAETFRRIQAQRMAGMPILNPYLEVEAVGFRRWQGQWVGVLITPWLIGLYVLPGDEETWPRMPSHGRCDWSLPAGEYEFLVDQEEGFGPYHVCTLMSPVKEFNDQATARAAAEALMAQLFAAEMTSDGKVSATNAGGLRSDEPLTAKGVTRRHFLRGSRG